MRFPRPLSSLLAILGLLLAASVSEAAIRKPVDPAPSFEIPIRAPRPLGESCLLGEARTDDVQTLNFIIPPDPYHTLLDPAACSQCADADIVQFTGIHLWLFFRVSCTIPVRISVVGTTGSASCPAPDPTRILCLPQTFEVAGAPTSEPVDYRLPFTDTCEISEKAFLFIEFPTDGPLCNTSNNRPLLLIATPSRVGCVRCRSYNIHTDDEGLIDLCFPEEVGNPIMFVDIDACFALPPPAPVLDLAPLASTDTSVTLKWTATGNTGTVGSPAAYLVRAAERPLDDGSFEDAPFSREVEATVSAGGEETLEFGGLEPGRRYWFALKARAVDGDLSMLSNLATEVTQVGGPLKGRTGPAIVSLVQPAQLPVQLYWQSAQNPETMQYVRIYDGFGRLRRVLPVGTDPRGWVQWDGRDDDGKLVFSGVYFVRLTSGGTRAETRIVLLR